MFDLTKTNTNVYTNKTHRHDITEILLRVALNSINLTLLCFIIYRYVVKIWSFIVVKKIIRNLTVNILPEKKTG